MTAPGSDDLHGTWTGTGTSRQHLDGFHGLVRTHSSDQANESPSTLTAIDAVTGTRQSCAYGGASPFCRGADTTSFGPRHEPGE